MIKEEKIHSGLRYLVCYPKQFDFAKKYPTLLFLHGAGTIGNDIEKLRNNSFFAHAERHCGEFVIFAPQCDEGMVWFDVFEKLRSFASMIPTVSFVDPSRFYLMGTSMGGYGAWQLAMSLNRLFAAVIPICGGGMYWNAAKLKKVPVWAFHGAKDPVVLCEESHKMVNAVNAKGGNARLTVYPENAHNAWDDTYGNPEVWAWLLSQCRDELMREASGECFDGKAFG